MAISKIITGSLTDDAVTSAKIGTDQVGADALSSSAISGAVDIPANSVGESELSVDYTAQSVPHIIPGVLQPAVAGKLLNGATHSGNYGTPQTQSGGDGHSYYYTDVRGSQPIKDPRIGAHYGSQRHKIKTLQVLEQETANLENNYSVYSLDGRKWLRLVSTKDPLHFNRADGVSIGTGSSGGVDSYFEIVGYFSDMNIIGMQQTADRGFNVKVDGGTATSENNSLQTVINSPLGVESAGRFVDSGSVVNLGLNQTLGIHTVRVTPHASSDYVILYGIELIAQDTASDARRSEIKIPKQNVVSFGKKFEVGSDDLDNAIHPHYDPFTTMSYGGSGTTASALANLIDTDTSLGMDNWKAGTSNYHRPWNGGRVVKWVDSAGTIKTSVTMMPPNAQNVTAIESNSVSNAHIIAGTNDDIINFDTTTIANATQLYEVAKTFHFREFGNGAGNQGNGGSYPDATMFAGTATNIQYVMDDGLTAIASHGTFLHNNAILGVNGTSDSQTWITFIGSGLGFHAPSANATYSSLANNIVVQNLPYGTHVANPQRKSGSSLNDFFVDGVKVKDDNSNIQGIEYIDIFQPKRPPIPEDCVVLADYMLMADFVAVSSQTVGLVSKGVREQNPSRDVLYDGSGYGAIGTTSASSNHSGFYNSGHSGTPSSATSNPQRIPAFGTNIVHRGHQSPTKAQIYIDSTSQTTTDDSTNSNYGSYQYIATSKVPGVYNWGINATAVQYAGNTTSFEIVTPIHTSSHYQTFETHHSYELVGGDRNMEQTNLVCTPDGKTWDEITRDTSYIGISGGFNASTQIANGAGDLNNITFSLWRGGIIGKSFGRPSGIGSISGNDKISAYHNKDFAISNDRIICLREGEYQISGGSHLSNQHVQFNINGQLAQFFHYGSSSSTGMYGNIRVHLRRGDYIQRVGGYQGANDTRWGLWECHRIS
jgi:hypothetical protein